MNRPATLLAITLMLPVWNARSEIKLPAIFADNMVLQQGISVPVWGKADPGEKVTVSVAGQQVSATADAKGKWVVRLQPLRAGGNPIAMTVSGNNTIALKNVLVGEVWLGSGQSNMQMSVMNVANAQAEMAAANYPQIRTFAVKRRGWPQPLDDLEGVWLICSPETINRFSAVLYFFGRDLQLQIKQPIGLINSSYGGTVIQSWTRRDVLLSDPETKNQAETRLKELDDPAWVEKKFAEDTAKYTAAAQKAKAENKPLQMAKPERIGPEEKSRPAGLYNGMIHPLLGYGIRGMLWYQGEYNAGQAEQYARIFPKMIADWRQQWGLGELPFFFVQLPPISKPQDAPMLPPSQTTWADLREAQAKTLSVPNTAMAVTLDTAPDGDLHPKDKQPVGNRLARLAAHKVYGIQTSCFSPMYKSHSREGAVFRLSFAHAGGGLVTKDGGAVRGFAIAGADRKFVWAEAKIEGEQVIVSSPEVAEPVAVRYGWANHPVISLFNNEGLPLAPFRTDDWK